jgi:hypothetical protein
MLKLLQNSNSKLIINASFALMVLGAWQMSEYFVQQFKQLPVKEIPKLPTQSKPVNLQALYPVLVEFKKKHTEQTTTDDAGIESIFKTPVIDLKKEIIEPKIDYAAIIRSKIRLTGTGEGGAFLNDAYVKVNDYIWFAAISDGKTTIRPVLYKVGKHEITVRFGKTNLIIKMAK